MAKINDICKCELCGNIAEMVHGGKGKLVCCGKEMTSMEAKTADWKNEKHVPIHEDIENGTKVIVGSTLHPMADDHFIEWIEIINGDYVQRKYLKPGDKPVAEFYVKYNDKMIIREYCNKHGLWADKK